jgi:hypothetical protein
MIDRDDKSTLVTKIIRRIQQRERAAIVCLLAKRCNMRGDCSYLQSERFYSIGRGSCLFSEKSSLLFRGPC